MAYEAGKSFDSLVFCLPCSAVPVQIVKLRTKQQQAAAAAVPAS
jgi:ribosomal protein S26